MSYDYQQSGLNNVTLHDGFFIEDDADYGRLVSFDDADGLQREIALALALDQPRLTGDEVRYLRKFLHLAQTALAPMLSVTEQTVSLWERNQHAIPTAEESLLRQFVFEHALTTQEPPRLSVVLSRLGSSGRLAQLQFSRATGQWCPSHIGFSRTSAPTKRQLPDLPAKASTYGLSIKPQGDTMQLAHLFGGVTIVRTFEVFRDFNIPPRSIRLIDSDVFAYDPQQLSALETTWNPASETLVTRNPFTH